MSKPSFSQSTYVKFTVPQNFVMMLTLNIFVTIMSMVSLTLQMETSSSGSSSGPSQICFYDEKSQRHYPNIVSTFNSFQPASVAHKCYAKIRLFCQSEDRYPQTKECAKKGILFYRRIPSHPLDCADKYFHNLPLESDRLELPVEFCNKEGEKAQECINVLHEYRDLVQHPRREDMVTLDDSQEGGDDLQQHMASVRYIQQHEAPVISAEIKSRKEIAKFALIHKDICQLDAENFERKYLEHISEHVFVTFRNRFYNPLSFCLKLEGKNGPLKTYSDLSFVD